MPTRAPASPLDDAQRELTRLRREITQTRQDAARLREDNARLARERAALERARDRLRREIERLTQALAAARRAGKRQAAPFSKGAPSRTPRRPGRRRGRQHGRHGHRPPPPYVDEIIDVPLPAQCPHCPGGVLALTVIRNPSDSSSRILPVRDVPIAGRSVRDTRVGAIPP